MIPGPNVVAILLVVNNAPNGNPSPMVFGQSQHVGLDTELLKIEGAARTTDSTESRRI
jgi:hypothetical protein